MEFIMRLGPTGVYEAGGEYLVCQEWGARLKLTAPRYSVRVVEPSDSALRLSWTAIRDCQDCDSPHRFLSVKCPWAGLEAEVCDTYDGFDLRLLDAMGGAQNGVVYVDLTEVAS